MRFLLDTNPFHSARGFMRYIMFWTPDLVGFDFRVRAYVRNTFFSGLVATARFPTRIETD